MKNILCLASVLAFQLSFAQFSGNINYQNQVRYAENNININLPTPNNIVINIKGMANVTADKYVAIFSLTQVAETSEEVNSLMDKRLNSSITEIKINKGIETYIDMVSFVPVYQYAVEKKIFSKKTYNEVPTGFELKKNLHVKFSDPSQLNELIKILAKNEIYDLVRVDYFANNLELIKKELANKAKISLQEKVKSYESLLGETFANSEKTINEGFQIKLPTEMYKSYEAHNSSTLALSRLANINQANKSTTLYYQPVLDKEFDFVINPTILKPVIQVMYEVKLLITKEKKSENRDNKSYILITPNGEMRDLNIPKSNK
ncbi:SIMPL domain-containing protein [Chryseobacterium wangxinyae]|uniref:SIMPL domain-containing protein n=1 Tax=Chryseobacterium sp. CY350 TaxID=2997336 RepID=UPI00226DA07C|nr:SIMPL domain-containing protein [Chryseobacterium sp. CY350]MCY0977703.1 SIMPL domain-containing protein [Chryseobacterium sp. CY350]WBZ95288.1 SIMPL domain-containing protein [Chryseobacterium sp. CY350]